MRDKVASFVGEIGDRILAVAAEHPDYMRRVFREMGKDLTEDELLRLIDAIKSDGIAVHATKVAWLQSTTTGYEIAQMLYQMPWMVAEASRGIEFLTSDAPIAKILTDPQVPRRFAGGWISPSAEPTLAPDTAHCLVIRPDGKEQRVAGPKAWCKDVNSRLVGQAHRFVVSRSRDSYVEGIARNRARHTSSRGA